MNKVSQQFSVWNKRSEKPEPAEQAFGIAISKLRIAEGFEFRVSSFKFRALKTRNYLLRSKLCLQQNLSRSAG